MNLLSKIQTSAASDAVKENAAKYVEVIEKYAPKDAEWQMVDDTHPEYGFICVWLESGKVSVSFYFYAHIDCEMSLDDNHCSIVDMANITEKEIDSCFRYFRGEYL